MAEADTKLYQCSSFDGMIVLCLGEVCGRMRGRRCENVVTQQPCKNVRSQGRKVGWQIWRE